MQLYERVRPQTVRDVRGHPKTVSVLCRILERPDFDRDAFWFEGPSGTGKTTLARCLSIDLADLEDIQEIEGANCTVDVVRDLQYGFQLSSWGPKGWKACIVNEAHAMTPKAVQAWLTLLEALPRRRVVSFTTTESEADLFGNFGGPLFSRCKVFRLEPDFDDLVRFAHEVAVREGLEARSFDEYRTLIEQNQGNMRAVFQKLETGFTLESSKPSTIPIGTLNLDSFFTFHPAAV